MDTPDTPLKKENIQNSKYNSINYESLPLKYWTAAVFVEKTEGTASVSGPGLRHRLEHTADRPQLGAGRWRRGVGNIGFGYRWVLGL